LATQGTFDHQLIIDQRSDVGHFVVGEFVRSTVGVDPGARQNVGGNLGTNTVDVLEGEQNLFAVGNIDASNTGHASVPFD